jgi:hypothetical protein
MYACASMRFCLFLVICRKFIWKKNAWILEKEEYKLGRQNMQNILFAPHLGKE